MESSDIQHCFREGTASTFTRTRPTSRYTAKRTKSGNNNDKNTKEVSNSGGGGRNNTTSSGQLMEIPSRLSFFARSVRNLIDLAFNAPDNTRGAGDCPPK